MRALIRFGKQPRLRFISHLDLQRFFQRAVNRTGLPIAYTQGFNPHPIMSFGSALALGWTSEYEVIDIKLSAPMGRKRTEDAVPAFMARETVPAMKKTKSGEKEINARPMVVSLDPLANGFQARLMLTEQESIKPDLLLGLLADMAGVEPPAARIHRLTLLGEAGDGSVAPLMAL